MYGWEGALLTQRQEMVQVEEEEPQHMWRDTYEELTRGGWDTVKDWFWNQSVLKKKKRYKWFLLYRIETGK